MDDFCDKAKKILCPQYVLENGTLDEDQFFYEYENEDGIPNDGQVYDRPRAEGGKPVNGLMYTLYQSGELESCWCLVDGFNETNNASFYKNGQASEHYFCDKETNTSYRHEWYEDGTLKSSWKENGAQAVENEVFDEQGNIIKKGFKCGKLWFSYDFRKPDDKAEVTWYEGSRFRKIVWNEPDSENLYRAVSFDESGNITELEVNEHYSPKYMHRDINLLIRYAVRYDDRFRENDGILMRTDEGAVKPFTGTLYDAYDDGAVKCVCGYKDGKISGEQRFYYPDGSLSEYYDSIDGRVGYQRYLWYASGSLKSALVFLPDRKKYMLTVFDESGNITDCRYSDRSE